MHRHPSLRPAARIAFALLLPVLGACPSAGAAEDVPPPAKDLPAQNGTQTAVLAMGCFWCSEGVFERVEGVTDVVSGYAGGTKETATYEQVSGGDTKHAESIRVTYDPRKLSYGKLLQIFFTVHDPTTKDRQGPDWGHQYRSAIFAQDAAQRAVAEAYVKQLDASHVFGGPLATTVEPLDGFYPAEAYHQDFVKHHPDHPYVRAWFPAKEKKLRAHFATALKKEFQK